MKVKSNELLPTHVHLSHSLSSTSVPSPLYDAEGWRSLPPEAASTASGNKGPVDTKVLRNLERACLIKSVLELAPEPYLASALGDKKSTYIKRSSANPDI